MEVYRIIELMHSSGEDGIEFVIERRRGFLFKRWEEVRHIENGYHKRISHHTKKDAEMYLLNQYTKKGFGSLVTCSGNVYYVEPYVMNFM
jgi:hypothetical protein